MRMPRWFRERSAQREVKKLRERVLGHWAAIGIDEQWTPQRHEFFLAGARRKRGLTP